MNLHDNAVFTTTKKIFKLISYLVLSSQHFKCAIRWC